EQDDKTSDKASDTAPAEQEAVVDDGPKPQPEGAPTPEKDPVALHPIDPKVPDLSAEAKAMGKGERKKAARGLRRRASIALRDGDVAGSERLVLESLTYDPGSGSAARDMALIYIEKKRLPEALGWALRATEVAPRAPDAHLTLGDVYQAAAMPQAARESFQRVLELDPDNAEAKTKLAP
ncbi:MAG: tetratricopeptide repeat protein, partial [Myxococcales bacterium]|nr:tetratricopeptide repeat protein [Myxococcales bacterium]